MKHPAEGEVVKTVLRIYEECRYTVVGDGDPVEVFREFLRDPNRYLDSVEERDVQIVEPKLSLLEEVEWNDRIAEAEMQA